MPDAVGRNLVEAKAKLGRSTRHGEDELGIEKRLAAGEAEDADALAVCVPQETESNVDPEAVGPFDGHTAVGAGEIALIRAGEGEIVGAEGAAGGGSGDRGAWGGAIGKALE